MIEGLRKKINESPHLSDLVNAIFFGTMSILFGYVKIKMPDFEGVSADFREIPLLIALFYIRSFWPIFILCLITIMTPSSVSWITVYGMHFIALLFTWFFYRNYVTPLKKDWKRALMWFIGSTLYYSVFIIPLLLTFNQIIFPKEGFNFVNDYIHMLQLIKYEYVVTGLVSTMYLIQLDTRQKLIEHEMTLENQVRDRTMALAKANKKLQVMNENLDDLAIKRSIKIENQLSTLNKYAQMNSHELRAPLSNILGLVSLLKSPNDEEEKHALISNLDRSAEKLDSIIKKMNNLLEKEMKLPADREEDSTF